MCVVNLSRSIRVISLLLAMLAISPMRPVLAAEAKPGVPREMIEKLYYDQQPTLWDIIDNLERERAGVVDLYFVGFAASADQDVFKREVLSVQQLFDRRFDTAGRSLIYVNSVDTIFKLPIATKTGLHWGLYWLGGVMNGEEDVLFLYLTSHGGKRHLSLALPPLKLEQLWASQLKRMLDDSGILWRVIVISGCYTGSFIDELKDANSLIITAAAADRPSFGCADGVDYTFWGKAYFDEALRRETSFIVAFNAARSGVTVRELALGYDPSKPQIFIGSRIAAKLAALEARLRPLAEPTQ